MKTLLSRAALALTVAATLALPDARGVTIDWVTVGDPGNTADTTGSPNPAGAVADAFQIMKYEWTNAQYVDFLNTVDPNGTNPNAVYNTNMGSNVRGGISFTSGNTAGSKYAARPNMGNKPVNYMSWFDAARVSNWLMNGATGTSSTETGAYTLVGGQTSGTAPAKNPGATFYIPTEDQWYKAAYYKGGGTNAGYWDYATQSDTDPTVVTAGTTGIGSAGGTGNFANYSTGADWNGQNGNVTTVGTNGGSSYYGGFWLSGAFDLSSFSGYAVGPSAETNGYGFRLASPVGVPEPSTYAMALAGLGFTGYSMFRRRKQG